MPNNALALSLGNAKPGTGGGGSGPPPSYTTGAVSFNGLTNLINATLVSTDNPTGSFSLWFQYAAQPTTGFPQLFISDPTNTGAFQCYLHGAPNPNSKFVCIGSDTGGEVDNGFVPPTASAWHHLLGSTDLTSQHSKVYVDGVDVSHLNPTGSGGTIATNGLAFLVADDGLGDPFTGYMADAWIAPGQYLLDGSGNLPPATLAKFISGGKPVNLGATGATPTGSAPAIFLRRAPSAAASTFGTNLGTGGAFIIVGSLTNAPSSPSD